MIIQIGKFYADRNGTVYGPIQQENLRMTAGGLTWTDKGTFFSNVGPKSQFDLIEEVDVPVRDVAEKPVAPALAYPRIIIEGGSVLLKVLVDQEDVVYVLSPRQVRAMALALVAAAIH